MFEALFRELIDQNSGGITWVERYQEVPLSRLV